jgi:hypothetical protein
MAEPIPYFKMSYLTAPSDWRAKKKDPNRAFNTQRCM